jgi:sigma-B regulation protein RsbU (phosphoserine phosphatase)
MDEMSSPAQKSSAAHLLAVPGAPPLNVDQFLLDLADALNTTLDLDTLLRRVAEMLHTVIPYEIFAILLVNEKAQDLRMRFQIGHAPEVERLRIRIGQGITGLSVQRRDIILVNDVAKEPNYINGHPQVRSEMAVPLVAKDKVIGVLDIQSSEKNFFREDHRKLMALVASRIAVAIENARLYTRVYKQAQTLQVLNEISRELTSILNLDQLLARIGELLSRVIDFQMFSILLLDEPTQTLQHRFSLRFKENIQLKHDIPLGRGLVGAAASARETVLVPDVSKDPRYIMLNPETRSELAVPLVYKNKLVGVLDIEHTRRGYFNEDHVRTMTTLAAQIAVAIENARLYERIAREEQRLERDLAMAREVQQHLLPQCCPDLKCADVAAKFVPAQAIGGDIYDFIPYSGNRTAITVGDVSGKGAPAALFGALVSGIMRSTAGMEPSPAEMLAAINTSLNERRIEARYVSIVYAVWDDEHHTMQVANSGQPRPIYCHEGKTHLIETAGLPLGLLEDAEYDEVNIQAHPGDVFVFFSDGMLDAQNAQEELFGRQRLEAVVRKHHQESAEQIVDAIFAAVDAFSAGVAAFDDETVLVVKVRPGSHGHEEVETVRKKRRKTSGELRNV